MGRYFNDDTIVFLVDRDPRDVYIGNKYFWLKRNQHVVFPMELEEFCNKYKEMRECVKDFSSQNVVSIHFEDLVYKYEETLGKIYSALGISSLSHIKKGTYFDPRVSINNTQLFRINDEYSECGDFIKKRLKEYIYEFPEKAPYEINHCDVF